MQAKEIHEQGGKRTFALIFDKGDKFLEELTSFAKEHDLAGSSFTAVGAFSDVTLGYFDRATMEYLDIPVHEQVEVLSLVGNIAHHQKKDKPKVHAHVVIGKRDGSTMGGHVRAATVWPTLEVVLEESPAHLQRTLDEETGLATISIHES